MKQIEISPAYKETLLGSLINAPAELQKINNIKISLINNGKVLAVPPSFDVNTFTVALSKYVTDTLKLKSQQSTDHDLNIVTFHRSFPPGLKKAVVYFVNGKYLYINVVPYKFIEDANYSEGKISELLTSGSTEQLFQFADDYIFSLYPESVQKSVGTQGRYFEKMGFGIRPLIAFHLDDDEGLLAKLNIYKVEQSKVNALTSVAAKSFYVLTTNGAYIFCLDQNLNIKYAEDLSGVEMQVKSRIGRDTVVCGSTSWITNRDNDFLYDEICKLNNADKVEKMKHLAILNFNFAKTNEETLLASQFLLQYAEEAKDGFFTFAAQFLVMKATNHSFDDVDDEVTLKLISLASAAVADADLYKKALTLTTDFKLEKQDIAVLMHIFNRTKMSQEQYEQYNKTLVMLKDRYLKLESDTINIILAEIETAKKLLTTGDRKSAEQIAESALNRIADESALALAPDAQHTPDEKFSGAFISPLAYEVMFNASGDPKLSEKYCALRACVKPLSENNISKLSAISASALKDRANEVLLLSDHEKFAAQNIRVDKRKIKGTFAKTTESLLNHPAMNKKMAFADLKSWLDKTTPELFDSIANFGEKATSANYPALSEAAEYVAKFFEIETPDVYVFKGEKSVGVTSYNAAKPFIAVGFSHLDVDTERYLSPNELFFALAREMANIKSGFTKLLSDKLFRDFFNSGAMNIDKISTYIPAPSFIAKNTDYYDKYRFASNVFCGYPLCESFESTDKQILVSLEKKLSIIHYKPSTPADLKVCEYAAVSRLMCHYADRLGLLFAGNIVTATNAIIKTDVDFAELLELTKAMSVTEIACAKNTDGGMLHADFALRIEDLISFYLSDSFSALSKQIFE